MAETTISQDRLEKVFVTVLVAEAKCFCDPTYHWTPESIGVTRAEVTAVADALERVRGAYYEDGLG